MRRKNSPILLITTFIMIIIFPSCIHSNEIRNFPYNYMLRGSDLSDNFYHLESTYLEEGKKLVFTVSFKAKNPEIANFITHKVEIYSSEDSAMKAYESMIKNEFHVDASKPLLIEFTTKAEEDHYDLRCVDRLINNTNDKLCEFVQVHNNIVVHVLGHINKYTITYNQFEKLLTVLDGRLPEDNVLLQTKMEK